MPFIGNIPTAIPLTGADIEDGTIGVADLSSTLDFSSKTITLPSGVGGKVLQVVTATDTNQYAVSVTGNFGNEQPVSTAFSITPSSTSSKIIVNFLIPMVDGNHAVSGQFVKVYRQINGGGYSALDIAHGTNNVATTGSGNSLFANIPHEGDANRTMAQLGGVFVDTSHNTTNQIDYKFYMGVADTGSYTVYVNRTANNAAQEYTGNTRTHVVMYEV